MFKNSIKLRPLLRLWGHIPERNFHSKIQTCGLFNTINVKGKTNITENSLFYSTQDKAIFTHQPDLEEQDNEDSAKELSPEVILEITKGDPTLEKKLRILMLEVEVLRQEGKNVCSNKFMKKKHWIELLGIESRSARNKYLNFLFLIECKQGNRLIKKQKRRLEMESTQYPPSDGHIDYRLGKNTIFFRIYETTINHLYNSKLMQAIMFSQKLVIDCGYDEHMTRREKLNTAKQLMLLFASNRFHDDPFDLHYCNANLEGDVMKSLHRYIPTMYEDWFPLNIHTESYLDLFPKQNLVYLTPHCRNDLVEYDHDAVYIIGAMVDKANSEPVSLAKAKSDKIKYARLPLDQYLNWGCGSGKSLAINQVADIMLDIRKTGDWNFALRHVPRRKVIDPVTFENDFDKNRKENVKQFRENLSKHKFKQFNQKKGVNYANLFDR